MRDKPFFDTNVFAYAIIQDDPRSAHAQELIAQGGTISVQVLSEFAAIARRNLKLPWPEIRRASDGIQVLCPEPLPLTIDTHGAALALAEGYGYKIYDALILASALEARCTILYSEDMQDGQMIEGKLTIRNPFGPQTQLESS
jgi:predicted nucleic acid-binding protein